MRSLSQKEEGSSVYLADTDIFFFYLKGGRFSEQARQIIRSASSSMVELRTSSEVYDDAVTAMRSDNIAFAIIRDFISKMKSIPHKSLPMSAEIAEEALAIYQRYGGRSKLSYFDSFHAATAKRYGLPLLTSDGYLIRHGNDLGISVTALSLIALNK